MKSGIRDVLNAHRHAVEASRRAIDTLGASQVPILSENQTAPSSRSFNDKLLVNPKPGTINGQDADSIAK